MKKTQGIHVLPESFQHRQIVIDLVGAGGTGSQVLSGLARLHVALKSLGHPEGLKVRVFDPDHVSESNIGRQLFAPSDVGHSKATILVNRINLWFGLDWSAITKRYAPTLPQGMEATGPFNTDFVITCVDTASARREIGEYLHRLRAGCPQYWLDCGNSQQTGQVFLTQPKRQNGGDYSNHPNPVGMMHQIARNAAANRTGNTPLPSLQEVLPELFEEGIPEDDMPSCSLAEALEHQDLFVNQHIATWALQLLWRLFRDGQLTTHGYWINLFDGRVMPVAVPLPAAPRRAGRGRKAAANG